MKRIGALVLLAVMAIVIAGCGAAPSAAPPDTSKPDAEPAPRTVTAAPLPTESDWEFGSDSTPSPFAPCSKYSYKQTRPAPHYGSLVLSYIETYENLGTRLLAINILDTNGGEHVIRSSLASLELKHPEATFTIEAEYAIGGPEGEDGSQETVRVRLTPYQRGVLFGNPQDTIITIIGSHGTRSAMFESDAWAWLSHAAVCLEGASSD